MNPKQSLKTLKSVLELLERYKLNSIEFNGIKVSKGAHQAVQHAAPTGKPAPKKEDAPTKPRRAPETIEELDALNSGLLS